MILSRVIEHVKKQHWTAIALDFVIVVAGVFVATQVSNWKEARADRALAGEYLGRLKLEVAAQITSQIEQKNYYEQARIHALAADRAFSEPADTLDAQFLIDLYQASQRYNQPPPKGTYDELISTGRITLIGNLETRNMLRAHYAVFAGAMLTIQETSDYRPRVREEIDDAIQRQIREKCGDELTPDTNGVSYHTRLRPKCTIEAPPALVAENVKRLRANVEIHRLLRFQLDILDNRLLNLDALIDSSRRLKTALEAINQ